MRPGQGGFQMPLCRGTQTFSQFETLTANGEQMAGWRSGAVKIDIDLHYRLRGDGVGAETGVVCRCKQVHAKGRRGIQAGIDEENALAILQIKRMLHLQLEVGEAFDADQAE